MSSADAIILVGLFMLYFTISDKSLKQFNFSRPHKKDNKSRMLTSLFDNDSLRKNIYVKAHGTLCTVYIGRLGNWLFQFASTFGVAKSKNMTMVINKNAELLQIFLITVKQIDRESMCKKCFAFKEKLPGQYDENILKLNSSRNYKLTEYLQSWKYFYNYSDELRKQLTFRPTIKLKAKEIIKTIMERNNLHMRSSVTLIAVHVRRGDMTEQKNVLFGRRTATPEYLRTSTKYFKSKYNNTLFIVASDGLSWTKEHMPNNIRTAYISTGKRELDMAVLTSCDHAITTVGSFSWWVGWLTGGEVTYFQWPAASGTTAAKYKYYPDYFCPHWRGFR